MPRCYQRNEVCPGLVDLLNDIEGMTLDRMKPYHLEFHSSKDIKRIACLCRDPSSKACRSFAYLAEASVDNFGAANQQATRTEFHNHVPYQEYLSMSVILEKISDSAKCRRYLGVRVNR